MDAFAISISHGLRHGVPLKSYVKAFSHMSFAPAGMTDDPEIKTASSLTDYIFRRLAKDYLSFDDLLELGLVSPEDFVASVQQQSLLADVPVAVAASDVPTQTEEMTYAKEQIAPAVGTSAGTHTQGRRESTAPLCFNCGNVTQRSGSCYVCTSCGSTTGCS